MSKSYYETVHIDFYAWPYTDGANISRMRADTPYVRIDIIAEMINSHTKTLLATPIPTSQFEIFYIR